MKRITTWLAMALLLTSILLTNFALADTKTIYINGQKAHASQIMEIEKAFGVTLLPNSHFILDLLTGNFYQSEDKAHIGNIYEYAFTKALELAAAQQAAENRTNYSNQRTITNSSIDGNFISDGNCSSASAGRYSVKGC